MIDDKHLIGRIFVGFLLFVNLLVIGEMWKRGADGVGNHQWLWSGPPTSVHAEGQIWGVGQERSYPPVPTAQRCFVGTATPWMNPIWGEKEPDGSCEPTYLYWNHHYFLLNRIGGP